MKATLQRLWSEDEAANAVEYGLIAAIIAVGLIFAFKTFSGQVSTMFSNTGNKIANNTQ